MVKTCLVHLFEEAPLREGPREEPREEPFEPRCVPLKQVKGKQKKGSTGSYKSVLLCSTGFFTLVVLIIDGVLKAGMLIWSHP